MKFDPRFANKKRFQAGHWILKTLQRLCHEKRTRLLKRCVEDGDDGAKAGDRDGDDNGGGMVKLDKLDQSNSSERFSEWAANEIAKNDNELWTSNAEPKMILNELKSKNETFKHLRTERKWLVIESVAKWKTQTLFPL